LSSVDAITPSDYWFQFDPTGDKFVNTGREILEFNNISAYPCTVHVKVVATVDGQIVDDLVFTVPELFGKKTVGPFPPALFNGAGGILRIEYDTLATINVWINLYKV
jgi:hypothetical protein